MCLVAVRAVRDGPTFVGSSLHFTQGREVAAFDVSSQHLALEIGLARKASGQLYLRLPESPRSATLDGLPVVWQAYGYGLHRFDVTLTGPAHLEVTW